MNQTIRNLIIAGIFVLPFLPLVFIEPFIFPFITGKSFLFRILVELVFGAWLILILLDKRYRLKISLILISVVLLMVATAFSVIFGSDPYRSFWSSFERMEGFVMLLHFAAYFIVVASMLNTEKLWRAFFKTSVGVSVFLCFLAVLQLLGLMHIFTDSGRLDSTFGNAVFFASYLLPHIFITMFLIRRDLSAKQRYVYIGIILLQTIILYLTGTRSAVLGLIVGIFIMALFIALLNKDQKNLRKWAVIAVLGIGLLTGGFFIAKDQSFIKENRILSRFSSISIEGFKNQPRYHFWNIAVKGFSEKPIFGWGRENFNTVFNKHFHPALFSSEPKADRVHNVFFEWLVTGGIVGFLAYISVLVIVLLNTWFPRRPIPIYRKAILTGFLTAYSVNNLLTFDILETYLVFFGVLAYLQWHNYGQTDLKFEKKNYGPATKMAIPAIAIVTILVVLFTNTRGVMASYHAGYGLNNVYNNAEKALTALEKSLDWKSFGQYQIQQEIAVTVSDPAMLVQVDDHLKGKFYNVALNEMQKQIEENPSDVHSFYLMGKLLHSINEYEEAAKYLEEAKKLSPNKQIIDMELARVYTDSGEYEKAAELIKKIYDPSDTETANPIRQQYAVIAAYLKDDALLSSLLLPLWGTLSVDIEPLIVAYEKTGKVKNVVEVLEQRLAKDPENAQLLVNLGVGYARLGQNEKAFQSFRKAAELQPSFKEKGEYWISQIQKGIIP